MSASNSEPSSKSHYDSLLGCLQLVCRIYNAVTTADALVAGLPLNDGKLSPHLFARAAERQNLSVRTIRASLANIQKEHLPATLLLQNDEACLLTKINTQDNTAEVIFPALGDGVTQLSLSQLAAKYAGAFLVCKPKFKFDERTPEVGKVKLRHWFWGVMAENKGVYRDVLLAAFIVNLIAIATPLFTMNVYDRVVPNRALETLWVLAIGVSILILGDLMLRSMRAYFLDWAGARVDVKLSADIMEQVLGMRLDQRPKSVGSFASNLRSFESVRDFITSSTVTTFIDIPFGLIFLLVIAWISPLMAVPLVAGAALMLIYAFSVQAKMHALSETVYRASAVRNATLIETLVSLETVKSLGIEGKMQRRWEQSATFLTAVGSKLKLLSASIYNGSSAIQQLVNVAMVLLGVYLINNGELTMGALIACTMLASRALAPIAQVTGLMTQYHTASTSLESLNEVMHRPIERPADAQFLSRPQFRGDIEFREVSFNYPGSDELALNKVSFKIKAGEHVVLLGRMGSGKSTIHKLILGLYQPTQGAILIDGVDIRQIDPAELRRALGHVQQETQLFYGTMRDNLTIAAPFSDADAILSAMSVGGIDEFVNTHPKGLDLQVGERGDTLSGGQKQGVGIARAFLHNPAIFLLDEPTSAMDHSSEDAIKKRLAVATAGKTVVLISHRSALFEIAERMIVIDSGRVLADGPKEQVIEALKTGKVAKAL